MIKWEEVALRERMREARGLPLLSDGYGEEKFS